jgi:hypothetical protein
MRHIWKAKTEPKFKMFVAPMKSKGGIKGYGVWGWTAMHQKLPTAENQKPGGEGYANDAGLCSL